MAWHEAGAGQVWDACTLAVHPRRNVPAIRALDLCRTFRAMHAGCQATDAFQETAHVLQVTALVKMDQVIAREPVQGALLPVLPQQPDLLRRYEAISGTTDDQAFFRRHQ